jgi:hypothetical protein
VHGDPVVGRRQAAACCAPVIRAPSFDEDTGIDGHTPADVLVRILRRVLALTAATWHNDRTGHPVKRSLLACDH